MEQYKLIHGTDLDTIQNQVQEYLNQGWTAVGELKMFTPRDNRQFQAFVQQISLKTGGCAKC